MVKSLRSYVNFTTKKVISSKSNDSNTSPLGNDDVKVETLAAIGIWLKSCSVFTDPVLCVLNDALSGKEVLKAEALSALSTCRQNTELFTSV